jgi:hypothetical protein
VCQLSLARSSFMLIRNPLANFYHAVWSHQCGKPEK